MLILGLFAHPDDAELWAGGTLAKHGRRGDEVRCVTLFEHTGIRVAEARAAAAVLGTEAHFVTTEAYARPHPHEIDAVLDGQIPDVVVTHWQRDVHLEHRICFELALELAHRWKRYRKKTPILLMTSGYYMAGEEPFAPDLIIDIDAEVATKTEAIWCYRSQKPETMLDDVLSQNRLMGARIGCGHGEGFIEYPLFGFCRTRRRDLLIEPPP